MSRVHVVRHRVVVAAVVQVDVAEEWSARALLRRLVVRSYKASVNRCARVRGAVYVVIDEALRRVELCPLLLANLAVLSMLAGS